MPVPLRLPDTRPLVLNAVSLYTLAFLLTTTLHELGHALMSAGLGGHPIQYSTHVENATPHLPDRTQLLIALAGPGVSLVQGILFLALARRSGRAGAGALLRLYLGLFGVINFFGYVMTGPFFSYGDLGQAMALLHVPKWLVWALAATATLVIYRIVARTGPQFRKFVPTAFEAAGKPGRMPFLRGLLLWPWLLGSGLILALSWPAPTFLSVLYPPMSSMVLGAAYGTALRGPAPAPLADSPLLRWQWAAGAALVGGAVLFRWLGQGVAW